MKPTGEGLFRTATARRSAKDDATTQAAREIIEKEVLDRTAKTERLRAARLARETNEPPAPVTKSRPRKAAGPARSRQA